ncbi:putative copper resistance protein D [Cytobacillus oceanisediminis]|uniref:Putative copper resistance protein D n=1 Tax=Cytobacillus oceanisediminis TaxID=665099 RepID=A0A2V2ZWT4_9BACI|nr:CopD family protein [Cytobacillus oceanisediminis]PWW28884.1 putative copper resistance protein D [Cytobacillus oceanisediminis]
MSVLIPLAEIGTYILFSIIIGHIALQFVPEGNKPRIGISKKVLLLSTLGIYIFSFGPVAQTISYFSESVGLTLATYSVLTDFQVGRAWIFIGFMSVFLWITLLLNGSKYLQALWLILMVLAIGYSSHVASLSFWYGLLAHSAHFVMVTLWSGILIHVAWFSDDQEKWAKFLRWFTPLAILSLIVILISGLTLMIFLVEPKDYVTSWVLPYGQMLLLKHISIIPLLFFAFINGVLSKRALKIPSFNPRPWIKGESIIILMVFTFTSVLGTLSPPHEVEFTVQSEGASRWVEWLLGKKILTVMNLHLIPNFSSLFLIAVSLLFLALILISFNKVKPYIAVFFGLSFVFALYFGLMVSLVSL